MFIREFRVRNFKSFQEVTFHFNHDLNIFTGANNAGKTTALEALSLWVECFLKLLKKAERSDTKLGLERGGYRLGYQKQNYFESIVSTHLSQNRDLFYQTNSQNEVLLQALLEHERDTFELGFVIVGRGNQFEVNLAQDNMNYSLFNKFFSLFPRPVKATFTRPVSFLEVAEEFQTPPKIIAMQDAHRAFEVTRNRLYQLSKDAVAFGELRKNLGYILGYQDFNLQFVGRETDDVVLKVLFTLNGTDVPKEISLLGSGALQVIALLMCCYERSTELNLILLDEPDSHIHRDIQSRMLDVLTRFTDNTQIFLTTHNESLIRSADPSHLFHLVAQPTAIYRPIITVPTAGVSKGFQPTPVTRLLGSLGSHMGLEFISALEADRIFLVEGQDDATHFDRLMPKTRLGYKGKHMFWAHRGVGDIFKNIMVYKDIFAKIRNQSSLWEKSKLIIDKDFLTEKQRLDLMAGLSQKLEIPVHIWSAYTFESTLLKDVARLARLVGRYLGRNDTSTLEALLQAEVQRQCDLLISALDDQAYLSGLFYQIKNTREHLSAIDKRLANVLPSDDRIQSVFRTHALEELTRGVIHHMADKQVFGKVIGTVFTDSDKTYDESILPEILLMADPGSWVAEWTEALNPM